jgi:hypothetical protein
VRFGGNLTIWHEDLWLFLVNSRSTCLITKMFQRNGVEEIKPLILWQKCFFGKSCWLREMWKNIVSTVRYDLGLKNCWSEIKDFVNIQGDRFEYFNMMVLIKLSVNSHSLSLYQLYNHACWILGKDYHRVYKQLHVDTCGRLDIYIFVFDWPNW